MDQEFEGSSEEKLHNEVECHEQQGLGLHQAQVEGGGQGHEQGLGQAEGKGQGHDEQGLDQGFEVQGQGVQGQEQDLGQGFQVQDRGFQCHEQEGQGQGKGHLFGREKPVHSALGGGTRMFSSPICSQLIPTCIGHIEKDSLFKENPLIDFIFY